MPITFGSIEMAAKQPQGIPLSALTIDQLLTVKSQLESELQKLSAAIQLTNETVAKAQRAKEALAAFTTSEPGREMLVPITDSMYIHGIVQETKRPIIELGTGYFAETSVDNAQQFFSRKISRVNTEQEALRTAFKDKQQYFQVVVQIANQKLQAARTQH
jgi:prefoldin alpha subunit